MSGGGRFDFDDGGTYCGGWEDGKAHGYGVCTGPKGQGEYAGAWYVGFEISGVYTWPSGNTFEGQWLQGKRHGVGVETKGKWVYRGEWTQGFKGRYGVRISTSSGAKYEGTWTTGLQDGYGVESYADGGTYQGQWLRGMRHGYGVRQSVPYGLAAHYRPKGLRSSLTSLRSEQEDDNTVKGRDRRVDEGRGGFVLTAQSDLSPDSRRKSIFDRQGRSSIRNTLMKGLKLKKQKSTGDIQEIPKRPTGSVRSTISNASHISSETAVSAVTGVSHYTDSNQSFVSQDDIADANITETYMGEWKNDKRSGFGVCERTDGLKYEGEWFNNKKYGYGVTTFKDGTSEEGKFKNNVLVSSGKKSKMFLIRSSKLRERIDNAVTAAQRAAQIALQKADIANSRMANARAKAEAADAASKKAREDAELARIKAKEFAPEFHQPGTDITKKHPPQLASVLISTTPKTISTQMLNHVAPPSRSVSTPARRQESVVSLHRSVSPTESRFSRPETPLISSTPMAIPSVHNQPLFIQQNVTPLSSANHVMSRSESVPRQGSVSRELRMTPNTPDPYNSNKVPNFLMGNGGPGMNVPYSRAPSSVPYTPPIRSGASDSEYSDSFVEHRDRNVSVDRFSEDHFSEQQTYSPYAQPFVNNPFPSAQPSFRSPTTSSYAGSVASSDDIRVSRSLQRRKSTPSIVKHEKTKQNGSKANKPRLFGSNNPTNNSIDKKEESETFIIEDGMHKKVQAEVYRPNPPPSPTPSVTSTTSIGEDKPKELPQRFHIEPTSTALRRSRNMGSMPDVTACKELKKTVMPRQEVAKMSHARREELRVLREMEEQRSKLQIVLRLADLKDWCQQRQLLMLVIVINLTLASMFFSLLAQ